MEITMLLIAFGTRPEWIKVKPVVDAIKDVIPYKLLFTGQHFDLIDSSLNSYENLIELSVDDCCDIRLDSILSSIICSLPESMYGASHVMVQGDTTSAFAVALAAFHRQIPVVHLEAGLRTYDTENPYPEEFNRAAITALAKIHLCPTEIAAHNVRKSRSTENCSVYVTGNTVLDNLVGLEPEVGHHVLVTMHRRENLAEMHRWFDYINAIARYDTSVFYLPMHPNPEIQEHRNRLPHVNIIDPLSYGDCIEAIRTCTYVITDSGGIQEESAFLKKKCIVCRKTTERFEGVGTFAWMCPRPEMLESRVKMLKADGKFLVDAPCPYGDGTAAKQIKDILIRRNEHVSVIDTFWFWETPDKYKKIFSDDKVTKLSVHEEDIRGVDFSSLMGDYDAVINLACISNDISSDLDPKFTHDVSYNGVMNVLRGAEVNKVRLIQVSSGSVYGVQEKPVTETTYPQPITQYAQIKGELDHYLQWLIRRGYEGITILRPATLYGYSPRQRLDLMLNIFADKVIRGRPIVVHGGKQSRPALHVRDFSLAITQILFNNKSYGEIYNVSKEAHTVMEYARLVQQLFPDLTKIIVEDVLDQRSWRTDSEKIYRELGIIHPTKLENGLVDLVSQFDTVCIDRDRSQNIKVIKEVLNL
jgi:UDP-N-acetylglucosamine 2-epimerase (non-hydrolysing)